LEPLNWEGVPASEVTPVEVGPRSDEAAIGHVPPDVEFHAPVADGVELRVRSSLEDVSLKRGRSGGLILLTLKTVYADGEDRPLVTCSDTIIAR
jgi:acyl dehydratase